METHQQPYSRPTLPLRRDPKATVSTTTDHSIRTSVARPDDFSFVTPAVPRKVVAKTLPVRYKTESRSKKGIKGLLAKSLGWIKAGVVVFILARLLFSEGGVIEYIGRNKTYNDLALYQQSLTDDNESLVKEIKQIETDVTLQKELMREHLGLIAPDEYMILFGDATAPQAK